MIPDCCSSTVDRSSRKKTADSHAPDSATTSLETDLANSAVSALVVEIVNHLPPFLSAGVRFTRPGLQSPTPVHGRGLGRLFLQEEMPPAESAVAARAVPVGATPDNFRPSPTVGAVRVWAPSKVWVESLLCPGFDAHGRPHALPPLARKLQLAVTEGPPTFEIPSVPPPDKSACAL